MRVSDLIPNVLCAAIFCVAAAMPAAAAEWQVSGYSGYTFTHDSKVRSHRGGVPSEVEVGWEGQSFEAPIYYGFKVTRWFEDHPAWGAQVDFNHIKTYAKLNDTAAGDAFDVLEFTDGLNIATVNGVRRWRLEHFTPYAGLGLGVNVPHVEVTFAGSPEDTFEYQLGGVAAVAFGGVDVPLFHNVSLFGEYKASYAHVDADLQDGSLSTSLFNHHLNVGLSYRFGGQR